MNQNTPSSHVQAPRFLVVGCGSIGKRHIRNLLALGERSVVAFDVRPDRREEVEKAFGIPSIGELDAAWKHPPEVVLITTPTRFHVPVALEAAERGCHLFIEKPLSDTTGGDLDRLVELARSRDLVTLVGCNLRFHPGLRAAKHLLDERRIGRVVSIRVEFGQYLPDWHPYEDYRQGYSARRDLGGGVVLDAIHEIDYARWLIGEIEAVACLTGHLSHLEIDTEDMAVILAKFVDGPIGEIHLDYVQRAYHRACHIVGDEGTIRWDFADGTVRWYEAGVKEWHAIPLPAGWEANTMYVDEMQSFLRCLDRKEVAAQDIFEAERVLRIAIAAKRAAETGCFERLAR